MGRLYLRKQNSKRNVLSQKYGLLGPRHCLVNELRHATSFTYILSLQFAREFDSPTNAISWETRGQNYDYKGKPLINALTN